MSIDAEEAAIRTVILGALRGDPEAGERNFDALSAMRQAETIVKALKVRGYEIRKEDLALDGPAVFLGAPGRLVRPRRQASSTPPRT
jgi:hypothetical protein